ncbi:4-(cytidine 5'-diphospho)-2-C-methyl-D-erythritol kinase [Candidatus Margulisiibacteriota bacterium]
MKVNIITYAKLNLSLRVYAPLKNNYHPICSIFQNISLYDELAIKIDPIKKGLTLSSSNKQLPLDKTNILTKIYTKYQNKIPFGLDIRIKKNIPIGSGMGGGSSNAGGFLAFLNLYAGWNLSDLKLAKLAVKFGADIPFFLFGGTALVRGIGDKIKPINTSKYKYFVLINKDISINTKTIYQDFDKLNPTAKNPVRTPKIVLKQHLGENFLKAAVFSRYPDLKEIENIIINAGAPKVYLSGSGATLFLAFKKLKEAQKWQEKISGVLPKTNITLAKAVTKGFELIMDY